MTLGWPAVRRLGGMAALFVVVAALAYCAWFRVDGGRWERVESPSMGTTAPVGTLLWVRSVDTSTIRAGDVVTFHRPGSGDRGPLYSHRVTVVHDDGSLATAGDLSGPDQWRVAPSDVVGLAVRIWPGVGWLVLIAPVLVVGGGVTAALARPGRRAPIAILGVCLTLSAAIVIYHPLIGAQSLGSDRVASGVRATYVSTGVLPVRLNVPGTSGVVLHAGESGSVVASAPTADPPRFHLAPALPWWFWPLLVGACFAPALGSALLRRLSVTRPHRRPRVRVGVHQGRRAELDPGNRPSVRGAGAATPPSTRRSMLA